jgi:rubrerythrin
MANMSYESIKSMFQDILEFEESALAMYSQIVLKLKNEDVKKIIREIIRDEARHAHNAQEILAILSK